ncbi:MAG: hypothetical protein AB7F86_09505 [Bdellovibrionales bacterium]
MRNIFMLIALLGMSAPTMAAGVDDVIGGIVDILRPGGGGHGGGAMGCTATDRGWEEHFGGHGSCDECLRRHGSCVERCNIEQFQCIASGYRWGRRAEFEGYGQSRREAQWDAVRNCENRGGRNCQVDRGSCRSETRSEVRECRGGGHGGGHGGGWGGGRGDGPGRPGRGRHLELA